MFHGFSPREPKNTRPGPRGYYTLVVPRLRSLSENATSQPPCGAVHSIAVVKEFEGVYCLEGGKMRAQLLLAIAFWLIAGASLGFCQVAIKPAPYKAPPSLDSIEIHQLFFERVARSNPRSPFTFQSDLTDGEMAIMNNVAADCDSKLGPLSDQPVRW